MVMNKHLLMWKAPLDSAMIDPDELQSYLDQGWKEVGWIVCEPSNLAGGIPVVIQPLKVAQIVSGRYETMKDEDPPKAQAVEREVRTITDAFERLLDMEYPPCV